ncbi:MAG TPA: sulfite exporter TauE/SafE family protein [Roseiflexaceae bacterium]|nr:sulfite exporter TauE/SafE family protein [Roseiflexaceae bacterium]HMP40851.1 sulfite exporter TauE/SafE family protein [Roseiflexaceae bacterium]
MLTTTLLALLLGSLIGLSLGMLGGGGSILTVPALVYVLGQEPHAAVSASLVIVGLNAATGAWFHQRAGHVRLRSAAIFGGTGLAAAFAGARISQLIPSAMLMLFFAMLMLVVAALMLRGSSLGHTESLPVWWKVLLGGLGVGFLTGFLGVGGGFLIVPALVLLLGMSMRDAVGSSLVVIAINSAAGLAGHLGESGVSWLLVGLLLAGGLPGLLVGTRLAQRLPVVRLRQGFAMLVILLGSVLLAVNLPLVLRWS